MKYLFLLLVVFWIRSASAQGCMYIASKKDSSNFRSAQAIPLYVINGEIQKSGDSLFIHSNPSDVEAISILDDKKATEKYGSLGVNGAILITIKRKK